MTPSAILAMMFFFQAEPSGSPAAPGPAPAPAQAPTAGAQAVAPDSEAELDAFARATIKLHGLKDRQPEAMAAAIQAEGLSMERYNALASRMTQDQAYAAKVNASLQRAQAAATSAAQPGEAAPAGEPARTLTAELPTTGPGSVLVQALTDVCLPMVREDRPVSQAAPAKGFKKDRRAESYTRALEGKGLGITVFPRGSNEAVCRMEVRHAVGGDKPIVDAATVWAALAKPALEMRRNDVATGADGVRRRTLSWDGQGDGRQAALVLVQSSRPDGTPLNDRYGTMTLLYSETPLSPAPGA